MIKIRKWWVDPAWYYADNKKIRKDTKTPTRGIGACHHYSQMKTPEIMKMGEIIRALSADRCSLHMWFTSPLLPDALKILDAWQFKWATIEYVWVKLNKARGRLPIVKLLKQLRKSPTLFKFLHWLTKPGTGFYTMSNIEGVIRANRGKPIDAPLPKRKARQVQYWPLLDHSRKPLLFQDLDEWSYPYVQPKVELFARNLRIGINPLTKIERLPTISLGNESPVTYKQDIFESLDWLKSLRDIQDYNEQQKLRVLRNVPLMKADADRDNRDYWWLTAE